MKSATLLLVDAGINLALGLFLLIFPREVVSLLGIPDTVSSFYPSILGAVLFGIGIALLIEKYKPRRGIVGLGLGGAIAINLCGGAAIAIWLIFGGLKISALGYLLLGALALILIAISAIELRVELGTHEASEAA
jgi:hypothetical protein